ncbi:hypothetical protein [Methylobrevis pamukkalensis]|nr:hypothetical protein [Methylobrevis pamukkalensis]
MIGIINEMIGFVNDRRRDRKAKTATPAPREGGTGVAERAG